MKGRESKVDRAGWLQIVIHSEPKKENKKKQKQNKNKATKNRHLREIAQAGTTRTYTHWFFGLFIVLSMFFLHWIGNEILVKCT